MTSCGTCGAEQPPGARSCARCGAPAAGAPDVVSGPGHTPRDIVPARAEPRAPWGRRVAVVSVAALTAGAVGAAVYASTFLGGGGAQPEDVLPAGALGFVKLDFDPSAGQKVAAFRLAQHFPDSGVSSEDGLRDDLLRRLLDDPADREQFEQHVQPWLGQRAGVAFLAPTAEAPGEPAVVAAVQVTDRDEATAGLEALRKDAGAEAGDLAWGLSEDEDYVLLAEDEAVLDRALDDGPRLSGDASFEDAVEALDGDTVALGWVDVGAVWEALPETERSTALEAQPGLEPTGLVVVGAHVEDDALEVEGRTVDLSAGSSEQLQDLVDSPFGQGGSTGLVRQLPSDTVAALSLTGLGDGATKLYESVQDAVDGDVLDQLRSQYGLQLPDDLQALLGSELAAGVGGDLAGGQPTVEVQVRTDDPARAVQLIGSAREDAGAAELQVEQEQDGYLLRYGTPAGGEQLGETERFRNAVPDAADSGMTVYVDLQRALEQAEASGARPLTEQQRRNVEPLDAVGYTATVEERGNAGFRLRLTVW